MPRIDARALHEQDMQDPAYREAYDALAGEFSLIEAMLDARRRAGLTQAQVAERMGVKQPVVAKLESGRTNASLGTLERYAAAVGCRLDLRFQPAVSPGKAVNT